MTLMRQVAPLIMDLSPDGLRRKNPGGLRRSYIGHGRLWGPVAPPKMALFSALCIGEMAHLRLNPDGLRLSPDGLRLNPDGLRRGPEGARRAGPEGAQKFQRGLRPPREEKKRLCNIAFVVAAPNFPLLHGRRLPTFVPAATLILTPVAKRRKHPKGACVALRPFLKSV